jgi:hypothetical protein
MTLASKPHVRSRGIAAVVPRRLGAGVNEVTSCPERGNGTLCVTAAPALSES